MAIAYEYRPGVCYLNVTNRCSNDCDFCVRQSPDYSLAGVDMRLAQEPEPGDVLADLARLEAERGKPFGEVVFCGFGEPTERLALIREVGRHLRLRGTPVRLNTNGQAALINERDPLPDLEGAVDQVSISLNAPNAEQYAVLCNSRFGVQAWPALLAFTRACVAHLPRVTLTVVGHVLSDDAIDQAEALAAELGGGFRVR